MARRQRPSAFGSLHKDRGDLKVTIETPEITGIDVDWDAVLKAVGQAEAARIRKRLKAGQDGDGHPLPTPLPRRKTEPAGRPLNRTGNLIDSIKYRNGLIAPSTTTRSGIGSRARSNFGLMKIHISGVYEGRNKRRSSGHAFARSTATIKRRGQLDPLGSDDPKLAERLNDEVQKQLDRLGKRGKLELKARHPRRSKV